MDLSGVTLTALDTLAPSKSLKKQAPSKSYSKSLWTQRYEGIAHLLERFRSEAVRCRGFT